MTIVAKLIGRLQLPLQNSQEWENLGNAVRLVFKRDQEQSDLKLVSISLEAPLAQSSQETKDLYGEWSLISNDLPATSSPEETLDNQPSTPPRLEWRSVSLSTEGQAIELGDLKLKFQVFGANGWLVTEDKLSFSGREEASSLTLNLPNRELSTEPNSQIKICLTNALVEFKPKQQSEFYFQPSVSLQFDIQYNRIPPTPNNPNPSALAFYAKLKYALNQQIKPALEEATLLDDLKISIPNKSLIVTNHSLQFQWETCASKGTDIQNYYLLPGVKIDPEAVSGFTTLTFSARSGETGIPKIKIQSAEIEAIMYARWGNYMQETEPNPLRKVFASSDGDLVIGYTGELKDEQDKPSNSKKEWQESLLLNGVMEVKNLISWPSGMTIAGTSLSLPAVRPTKRVENGLQVLYTFQEGAGNIVRDVSGIEPRLDLKIVSSSQPLWQAGLLKVEAGTLLRSEAPAQKIINACKTTKEITLELWIKPDERNIIILAIKENAI